MRKIMREFLHAENGTTAIEYGLIAGLIVVAIIGGMQALGSAIVSTLYDRLLVAFQ
jgi:pilus assembly protein Flp/PilA